jgi:uncharacterized protein YbbK (DUF523 family)
VSSCLLGERVRWDGGHKRNPRLLDRLGALVDWVAVCPEVEMGLGTPREPINLMTINGGIVLMTASSGRDLTARMQEYAAARVEALAGESLSGYVLKSGSPSCGIAAGGLFAEVLLRRLPDLPIEEDAYLEEPEALERFVERVLAFHETRHV